MVEIRAIGGTELGWAVKMAQEVYERCVRQLIATQEEVEQFYSYVQTEYLWQEMTAGRLVVWGAWENGALCGICAMQKTGHVTMLYVRQESQRRGCGTAMLSAMNSYAAGALHLERITVNVTPIAAAGFFYGRGFTLMPGGIDNPGFVSLVRQTAVPFVKTAPFAAPGAANYAIWDQVSRPVPQKPDRVTYTARSVKPGVVIGLTCGLLGLMAVVTIIVSMSLLM
ncbi:MAG: GNAT family N-acetyltransferase [Roseburia sp.]